MIVLRGISSFLRTGRQSLFYFSPVGNMMFSCRDRLCSSSLSTIAIQPIPQQHQPIDFDSASSIIGQESHVLMVNIEPGQILRAETGAMLFLTSGIEMNTSLGGTNGISSGFKRMITGQNLFVSDFTYTGPPATSGTVGLGTDFPSKIIRFSLNDYGQKIVCQKGAFLAGSHNIQIELEFSKNFMTGFFGSEGFVLQALIGDGDVFCKAGGTLIRKDLKIGETLRISSGSLVAFTQDVKYDVQIMPGFKNVLFGGEGLFITTLQGPGTVWLQGLSPDKMISEIVRRIPTGGIPIGIPIPLGGDSSTNAAGDGNIDTTDVSTAQSVQDIPKIDSVPSNIDSESPEALYGDAVSTKSATSFVEPSAASTLDDKDDLFREGETSSTIENESLDDDFSQENSESFEIESTDSDHVNNPVGFFQKIWDFFRGDD